MNDLKCAVCGEMNFTNAAFCIGCGAPLLADEKKHSDEIVVESKGGNEVKQKASVTNKKKKNANQKPVEQTPRALSRTTLFYFVLVLVLIGSVILYSSGIFEQPIVTLTQQSDANNPHAGVDLSSLEQINTLEEKVKSSPNDETLILQLAHLLNDSGLKTRAIEEYRTYLKLEPKNADVWVDMGVCYYETGKNQDALSSMERALTIQPRHQIANLNLGIVNMASGNEAIALKYWRKAIEIDSTNEIGQKAKDLIKSH